ncbi:site-specific DNA-methyltransferase [Proteus mirabilis]|uniref:site-specific DNA-methyltransferase n=1 Tax=Proteus mirabilis TaxID=584 RepID=UPI0029E34426|nr:site-specific DNA-methyltransferase [Proteus mirabilis]
MDKLKMHSPDMTQQNIEKIRALFPNCVTESRGADGELKLAIDFDQLKQELSNSIVEGPQERYQLNWPGKREALLTANAPIAKTLRPCREESVNFDTTENLFVEGDNLDVLKALQETYLNKVRMIYIDPPYNTGRDFIYKDKRYVNRDEYLNSSNQVDGESNKLVSNTESNGRFHSFWLSMMYSRLKIARSLLSDNGVIFISIDDVEVDNLKKICNEIFGEENFIGCAGRITKKSNNKGEFWSPNFDYILTYVKNIEFAESFFGGVNLDAYDQVDTEGPRKGEKYQLVRLYMSTIQNRNPEQRFWIECPDGSKVIPPGSTFPPERPNLGDGIWRWTRKKFEAERDKIVVKPVRSSNLVSDTGEPAQWNVFTKTYLNDVISNSSAKPNSFIEGHINQLGSHEINKLGIPFDYSKPTSLIKYLMEVSKIASGDIVLDFFAGSSSTADAVLQLNANDGLNRKFVMVQLPEPLEEKSAAFKAGYKTIAEISKERIRRAGAKILEGECHKDWNKDVGFRVLKVDTSNMADVYYSPDQVSQGSLDLLVDNIKADRSDEDLLFQVLLDWGVDLTLPIRKETIQGKSVFFVDDDALVACFDLRINEALIKELATKEPLRVVFRDDGFESDAVKINAEQIFKQVSPHTEVKAI